MADGPVLGLIPARAGSKGVPDKNLRPLAGRTLLQYVADAARASRRIDRAVLSTDSEAIAAAGRAAGLEVPFLRPPELAGDDAPMLPVIVHALDALARAGWAPEYVVLLQPTSPLRRPGHIEEAVSRLIASGADSIVSVVEVPRHFSPDYVMRLDEGVLRPFLPDGERVTRRQDARTAYSRDGTVYAFRRDTIERFGNIYGRDCRPFAIDARESLSIDTPGDWSRAEGILAARTADGQVGR